jgi:hypothetical protein
MMANRKPDIYNQSYFMFSSNPIPGGIYGLPYYGGNKNRNLALQVGRVLKIETIEYAHESLGTET